ncbi:DUF2189 domain-containing protein [Silicimonas algicola]|uniref:Putative membrane protein n=1 Tax=Silicimonas algicola TaxID=1826607 RepID=A0A316G6Q4_9RHOB|nr:DUF2189 domain-containing protein [Silicimonas algicola]AZQ68638.1 DUF2189 domain-containing protein [Silicimonas algicola]PWK55636.1 putative membrane protein [Silicimonas algicola]
MLSDRTDPPPPDNPHAAGVIPKVVPPLPRQNLRARNLPWRTAFDWLRAGWSDLWTNPLPSLLYGAGVFALSILVVWGLFQFRYEYALFPALAGFMVIGPLIANGLYEKSRRLELGEEVGLAGMILVRPRSGYQALFMGVLLLGLFLLWLRAAVLIYALFFGMVAFPGTDELIPMLFLTPTGWALLLTGSVVGALFAAFAFAISVFAVPMLLTERADALSAMGISMAMVWANLPVMLAWGATVMGLFLVSVATAFIGLVLVFPVLGHATWHAYRNIRTDDRQTGESERMFIRPA